MILYFNIFPCYLIGKAVEVFDNEQVTFYFCNNMDNSGLFFNVLCLEETGMKEIHT